MGSNAKSSARTSDCPGNFPTAPSPKTWIWRRRASLEEVVADDARGDGPCLAPRHVRPITNCWRSRASLEDSAYRRLMTECVADAEGDVSRDVSREARIADACSPRWSSSASSTGRIRPTKSGRRDT